MRTTVMAERLEVQALEQVSMQWSEPILQLRGVYKQFGDEEVLGGVDLEVRAGTIVGIVGETGKSTVLAIAAGLLPPDEGEVHIGGVDPWENDGKTRQQVGLVPDEVPITDRLTCREVLVCVGLRRGLPRKVAEQRAAELLADFELVDVRDVVAFWCAPGQRLRLRIAAALLGQPRVLLLDDAFDGIDGASLAVVRRVVREFAIAGGSVLYVGRSHESVEAWSDLCADLVDGRLEPFRPGGRALVPAAR